LGRGGRMDAKFWRRGMQLEINIWCSSCGELLEFGICRYVLGSGFYLFLCGVLLQMEIKINK